MTRVVVLLVALWSLTLAAPARAGSEEQEIVDRAKIMVDGIRRDANMGKAVNDLLPRAKAVLLVPNLWRGGFILGGQGGTGLLLARGTDGSWSAPAFYGLGGGSIGFQAGAEMQELLLIVLTEGGLRKILDNQVKLGADLSFALGPIGAGVEGATTPNLKADIVAYSRAIGLFAGLNLSGSVINVREQWNLNYYGEGATSRAILFDRRVDNPGAADLRAALAAPVPGS